MLRPHGGRVLDHYVDREVWPGLRRSMERLLNGLLRVWATESGGDFVALPILVCKLLR